MPSAIRVIQNLQVEGPTLEVGVLPAAPIVKGLPAPVYPVQLQAMIDTGASNSVIRSGLLNRFGIFPVGRAWINTPSSTNVPCPVYSIQVRFIGSSIVMPVTVIEAPLQNQHIEFLIGRDLLSQGILVYQGPANSFTLAF